jgi:GNAT superfamily N-acetyltransferase
MPVELVALNPADDADAATSHRIVNAVLAADVPDFPRPSPATQASRLRLPWPGGETHHFFARLDGETVGELDIKLPLLDNRHIAEVELLVDPAYRRRGVGRFLFDALVEFARSKGRTVLIGQYVTSLDGPAEARSLESDASSGYGHGASGHGAFAAAVGAAAALPEVRRRLDLDTVDVRRWDPLVEDALAHATGYRLVSWSGPAPDDIVGEVARLEGRMNSDAPLGDLDIEPERYDSERLRQVEEILRLRGRRHYHVGALHESTGRLAAWTMLAMEADDDRHAMQQTTIVDPDHRGHRLGMLVKVENLRHALAHEPGMRTVDTWNAAENKHMIAINDAIGFHPVDAWVSWQYTLDVH